MLVIIESLLHWHVHIYQFKNLDCRNIAKTYYESRYGGYQVGTRGMLPYLKMQKLFLAIVLPWQVPFQNVRSTYVWICAGRWIPLFLKSGANCAFVERTKRLVFNLILKNVESSLLEVYNFDSHVIYEDYRKIISCYQCIV